MTLTLALTDEESVALQQAAAEAGVSVEELARRVILTHLDRSRTFGEAAQFTLAKNAELYRRLAQGPGQE